MYRNFYFILSYLIVLHRIVFFFWQDSADNGMEESVTNTRNEGEKRKAIEGESSKIGLTEISSELEERNSDSVSFVFNSFVWRFFFFVFFLRNMKFLGFLIFLPKLLV